ncbi:hypothetical protein NIES4101_37770 [Calothrix sp. NIES-4101]|nr:hypothetical protein NIES4101_37770 [Calothrix sp. NIES-4101]
MRWEIYEFAEKNLNADIQQTEIWDDTGQYLRDIAKIYGSLLVETILGLGKY